MRPISNLLVIICLAILLIQNFYLTSLSQSDQITLYYDFDTNQGILSKPVDINNDGKYDYCLDVNNWNTQYANGRITMIFYPENLTLSVSANLWNVQPRTWTNGYPEIFIGRKPWGTYYANGFGVSFPLKVSDLRSLPISFSVDIRSLDPKMNFNVAADAWVVRESVAKRRGAAPLEGDVEIMVWVFHQNLNPAGTKVGEETICGKAWEVWKMDKVTWGGWQYIAFKPKGWVIRRGSVSYDIAEFIRITAKYATFDISNHYLLGWEIGTEWGTIGSDGAAGFEWSISGFTATSPTPTPTLTPTPTELPTTTPTLTPTSTPMTTATPTATPTPTLTPTTLPEVTPTPTATETSFSSGLSGWLPIGFIAIFVTVLIIVLLFIKKLVSKFLL
ncbi:MAG: GH12 family glycosyl hydrolase domain-containing protein [Thermoproteota archaeon]